MTLRLRALAASAPLITIFVGCATFGPAPRSEHYGPSRPARPLFAALPPGAESEASPYGQASASADRARPGSRSGRLEDAWPAPERPAPPRIADAPEPSAPDWPAPGELLPYDDEGASDWPEGPGAPGLDGDFPPPRGYGDAQGSSGSARMADKIWPAPNQGLDIVDERDRAVVEVGAGVEAIPPQGAEPEPAARPEPSVLSYDPPRARPASSPQPTRAGEEIAPQFPDVRFASGQRAPDSQAAASVRRCARFLNERPGWKVIVEGHSDASGAAETNMRLSRDRAESVAQILYDAGVDSGRVTVQAYGEERPLVSPERSSLDRLRNRRVQLLLYY